MSFLNNKPARISAAQSPICPSKFPLPPSTPMSDLTSLLNTLLEKYNARTLQNPSQPKDEFLKEAYRIVNAPFQPSSPTSKFTNPIEHTHYLPISLPPLHSSPLPLHRTTTHPLLSSFLHKTPARRPPRPYLPHRSTARSHRRQFKKCAPRP